MSDSDDICPKCGANLILQTTRFGKKMKKCSTGGWDSENKKATGCDFIEWINGTSELLDLDCPECGKKLVLFTTSSGKKMEKCSTAGWDSVARVATGCTYIKWLKPGEVPTSSAGEEFLPPEPKETLKVAKWLKTNQDQDYQRYEAYSKGFRTCTIKPLSRSDIYISGVYIFYIGIYSDNAEPVRKKLSIEYDGKWVMSTDVMRSNHLKVKLLD